MSLTEKDVYHIARLARIEITNDEAHRYQKELSAILGYFEKLKEVNTDGVEPIGHITGMKDVVRKDVAKERSEEERMGILAAAKNIRNGYYKVPPVL